MNPAVQEAMMRANAAITQRNRLKAVEALSDAHRFMAASNTEDTRLRPMLPVQAAFMSCLVGNLNLAQQFATRALSEAAQELEECCEIYRRDLDQQKDSGFVLCQVATHYVVAFVPYVQYHPWLSWEELTLVGDEQANARAVAMLKNMRPELDRLGWASWPYPQEVEIRLKHWSARTFRDFGAVLLDNVTSGEDVTTAQALAEASLSLLKNQAPDQLTADAYNVLGRAFCSYDDFELKREKAIPCFAEAIRILDGIGNDDDAAIDRGNLGAVLAGLADFEKENGDQTRAELDYAEAEKCLRKAVDIHRTCSIPDHLRGALVNMGSLYMTYKDFARAESSYSEALSLVKKESAESSFTGIKVRVSLATVYLQQKKLVEAEQTVRQAITAIETPGSVSMDPETVIVAYGVLGDALRQQEKTKEAEKSLAKGVACLDSYCTSFFSERAKGNFLKTYRWVFEAMIDCCATLSGDLPDRGALAFNLAERIKWYSLTSVLRFLPLKLPGMELEPLLQEETKLLGQIFNVAIGKPGAGQIESEKIVGRLEQIWTELEPRYPEYVAIRHQKTVDAQEAATWLDAQVPVLVEYYLGDDLQTALAFVLKKGEKWPTVVRLPASPASLAAQVLKLRPTLDEQDFPKWETFQATSQELHRCLIEPILSHLPEDCGVCIVPFGALHNLPFATLFDGQRYLIERNALVFSPTATGLRWWRTRSAVSRPKACLIVGVSTRSGVGEDLNEFRKLAQNEIGKLFPQSVFIPSQEATKARMRAELQPGDKSWDVIHIACHGNAEKKGLDSYLEMQAGPEVGDSNWTAVEIFAGVRIAATLVTLSACDSGIAETCTNDEIAGLAQAFLFSGAASVLATLWRVQQGIGVEITRDFYKLWMETSPDGGPYRKIDALKIALQAHISKKSWLGLGRKPVSPYLWGTFQLYGDWR
jgi:CHAT domain-containing protein/tetratricopeptide (TPR) repeat protein